MDNKKLLHYFFIVFIVFSYFFTMPLKDTVQAVTNDISFEGVDGLQYSDSFLTSESSTDGWEISDDEYRTGTKCFQLGDANGDFGYFNLTYSKNDNIANISWYENYNAKGGSQDYYFYNQTNGSYTNCIIHIRHETTKLYYYNATGVKTDTGAIRQYADNWYNFYYIAINLTTGSCDYHYQSLTDYTTKTDTVKNITMVTNGNRIDRIYIYNTNSGVNYIDDMSFTLTETGGTGGTGGCDELYKNDQWIGTGFQNCMGTTLLKIGSFYYGNYVEFGNNLEMSGNISGFELATKTTMYSMDKDLSNYFLYINGISLGSPCESSGIVSGSTPLNIFKWEFSEQIINESITIELYHNYFGYGWELGYNYDSTYINPPSLLSQIWFDIISNINGVIDYNITNHNYLQPMWKLYFSDIGSEGENPNYNNSITVIGNGENISSGIQWTYQYDTIFFDVKINDTSYNYYINVYKDGVPVGLNQFYPIDIDTYQAYHGFTPEDIGLFKVYLLREGDYEVLNESFFVYENPSSEYIIYTSPNPSFANNEYTVFVNILDGDIYNHYYARVFLTSDTFNYNNGFGGSEITTIGNLTSFIFSHNQGTVDNHYWRIFASDDNVNYLPLGSTYPHFINRFISDLPYLSIDDDNIFLGESCHLMGYHPLGSNYFIYLSNTPKYDVTNNLNFNVEFTPTKIGVYTFSLRQNGITINNDCIVTLVVSEDNNGGGGGGFNIVIPQPYSYFAGIFVIVLMTLSPLAVVGFMSKSTGRDFNFSSIPQILYLIMAIIGFVITILFEWMPVWTVVILFVLIALIILILYFKGKGTTEG